MSMKNINSFKKYPLIVRWCDRATTKQYSRMDQTAHYSKKYDNCKKFKIRWYDCTKVGRSNIRCEICPFPEKLTCPDEYLNLRAYQWSTPETIWNRRFDSITDQRQMSYALMCNKRPIPTTINQNILTKLMKQTQFYSLASNFNSTRTLASVNDERNLDLGWDLF